MAHMRIGVYKLIGDSSRTVFSRAEAGLLPIFRQQPGFIAYEGVEATDGTILSLSTWQSDQQAEAATRQAAEWVRENLAEVIQLQVNYVCEVAFSSRR